jgi:hypothetical protein
MIYDVGVASVRSFDLLTPVNQKRFCKCCRALVVASSRNLSTSLCISSLMTVKRQLPIINN